MQEIRNKGTRKLQTKLQKMQLSSIYTIQLFFHIRIDSFNSFIYGQWFSLQILQLCSVLCEEYSINKIGETAKFEFQWNLSSWRVSNIPTRYSEQHAHQLIEWRSLMKQHKSSRCYQTELEVTCHVISDKITLRYGSMIINKKFLFYLDL